MSKIYVDEIAGIASADTVAIPGHVIQVVNSTAAQSVSSTSQTLIDTGLSATITPSSTSSKILIIFSTGTIQKATDTNLRTLVLLRGSTLLVAEGVGFAQTELYTGSTLQQRIQGPSASFLDSPATTSATTYKTQFSSDNSNALTVMYGNATSTMTLMEIAG